MRTHSLAPVLLALMASVLSSCALFAQEKNALKVEDGVLKRGSSAFTVRAITVPDIAKPGTTQEQVARAMNLVAEPGGNAVCFDVYGVAEDGKAVAPEGVEAMRQIRAVGQDRYVIGVVRVMGTTAPATSRARAAWAKTAAKTFREDSAYLYLFDGKDAGRLAKTFKREAKGLTVAAPRYGDVDVVEPGERTSKKPALILGGLPADVSTSGAHFVLPEGPQSYQQLETASADPSESQPWEPDNSVLSAEERAEGFIALFDGKSLNGWTVLGENKNAWAAKDGILMRVSGGSNGLRTCRRYANFIMRWEWCLPEGGNNGVHFRAPRGARASRVGFEYQMLGDHGDAPNKNSTGSIYDVQAPSVNAVKPNGEWNTSEAIFDGPRIVYMLNGVKVNEANMDENPELRPRLRNGFIVLTEHNARVMYRNIRIKPLP